MIERSGSLPGAVATVAEETALQPRALWRQLGAPWQLALWLVITLRVALELLGLLSIHLQPITVVGGDWLSLIVRGPMPWSLLLSIWQRWDALWYQQIAEHGYHAGNGTVAFSPLYPLVSRLVSFVLLGHIVPAELLTSSLVCFAALWLLYDVARLDAGPITARLTVLLLASFPVAFFLLAPFSDGLYLLLTLATFWYARRGSPWLAGLAGLAAGLTRPLGFLLVLPLAFAYLRQRDAAGRRPGLGLLAAILPAAGMIGLNLYQRLIVGETQSVFQIQAHWGTHLVPPWVALSASWMHIVQTGDVIEMMNLGWLLAFAVLGLAAVRYLPAVYALYVLPYLLLFFSHESYLSPLMSVSRYMLVLFPCFIVLASYLVRRRWLAASWLVTSLLLQGLLFVYFVHFGFVA